VGKNYLFKSELDEMGRLVNAFLDLAGDRARRRVPMTMEDWARRLDGFLRFADRPVLRGRGQLSMEDARAHALGEFERFRLVQEHAYLSDFDRLMASAKSEAPSSDEVSGDPPSGGIPHA
jgi:hypothetical protein